MGLQEARNAESFCAGVLERLREMGEVIGSKILVAKPEELHIPFVVEDYHDYYYLLGTLKILGEWKSPNLCVVFVSLENEV